MPDIGRSESGSDVGIDVEATICLVMRVERDESLVMDMSDVYVESVMSREAVNTRCVLPRHGIVPASSQGLIR